MTPVSFDVLSDVLRVVRLSGAVLFRGDFSAPWAVITAPAAEMMPMVLPDARQLMPFHIVEEGSCWIELDDQTSAHLQSGDIVVLPYCHVHTMSSHRSVQPTPCLELLQSAQKDGIPRIISGGGGEPTRLICGFLYCEDLLFNPLCRALPSLIHVKTAEERTMSLLAATVRQTISETHTAQLGSGCLLARLSETLFVEVLRRYMAAFPSDTVGWLGALKDPIVGRALQLMHCKPAHEWTVHNLARQVGASRSLLADRFKFLLRQPPIQYLTCWRLQLAAEMLRNGNSPISQIAANVGYDSEAAFNRAFKRYAGKPPAAWRSKELRTGLSGREKLSVVESRRNRSSAQAKIREQRRAARF
jgi:AraC family transcriptional regulator, alkane utilization regulator